jgi:hypothetical protein
VPGSVAVQPFSSETELNGTKELVNKVKLVEYASSILISPYNKIRVGYCPPHLLVGVLNTLSFV